MVNMFRRSFTYGLIFVGIIWALFVAIRYLGVDDNFLFDLMRKLESKNIAQFLVACIILAAVAFLFGYTYGQNRRRKIIIGAVSLMAVSLVVIFFPAVIQSVWLKVNNLPDGAKASLVVILAALLGVGVGFGTRIGQRLPTLGFLAVCLFLPFLFITLRAGAVTSLLALVWLFLLSDALGMYTLRWLNSLTNSPSLSIDRAGLLSVAVGLSILILVTLGLGLVGGVHRTGILLMLILLTLFCFAQIKFTLVRLAALPWKRPVILSEFELGGMVMLIALFLIYWVGTLAPEVGADALGFRVAAPAIWLREGIIRPLPEMLFSYSIFAGEILHLLVMPLTGFTAAKVVQFGLAILLIASAYTQVFEQRHRKEVALILFVFWGGTLIWWQMIWGFVDLSQTFFYFACILALRFWLDEPENSIWLIVAGIVGATATAIKLNGIGALISAEIIIFGVTLYRTGSFKKGIQNSRFVGLPALICLFPWFLRSYFLSKNPVFPFANQFFKSPLYPDQLAGLVGIKLSFSDVISVPWDIFFNPARFGSFATYHPLILALAFLGFIGLAWVSSPKDWLWLIVGILACLIWLGTEPNLRYSLYAAYLLVLSTTIGLMKWQERFPHPMYQGIFQLLLLLGMLWGFGMQALRPTFWMRTPISGQAFPSKVVFGEQTNSEYLISSVPTYFCAQWLNQHYSQTAKVWQVPSMRDNLYFNAPSTTHPSSILTITLPLYEILNGQAGNNASIYQRLRTAGYTHFVYNVRTTKWLNDVPESQRQGIFSAAFEATYLQLECADRGLRLYKILQTPNVLPNTSQLHLNILKNSGLDELSIAGLPLNWDVSGDSKVLFSNGNTILRLEEGATLTQVVTVNDDLLYELSAEYRANVSDPTATIQVNWYDSSGELHLFWRESITPVNDFVMYRFLQTAPTGVQIAVIYVSGNGIDVDNIIFRAISDEIQSP